MTIRLLFAAFCLTSTLVSQTNYRYKNLTDSVFLPGDKIIAPDILFALSGSHYDYPYFKDSVDKVADFLNRHPKFKAEIGSFTDIRGNPKDNIRLSQARAQTIVDYLIKFRQIDSSRLVIKGYGSSNPLITDVEIKRCKTKNQKEVLHQKNRRTEIRILSTD